MRPPHGLVEVHMPRLSEDGLRRRSPGLGAAVPGDPIRSRHGQYRLPVRRELGLTRRELGGVVEVRRIETAQDLRGFG